MKILLVHNYYQEPGGEDVAFEQERRLLERGNHEVITYTRTNQEINRFSGLQRAGLLKTIISAGDARDDISRILRNDRPDVVHTHNTFMMISPSVYDACADAMVPVVQTLHNYRLLCPAVTLYRNGNVCEECIDHGMLRGIKHGCYRDSRPITAAVVAMLRLHELAGTWNKKIAAYIALTNFARNKFADNGLPRGKIHVKPNFVDPDPGEREGIGDHAVFLGRLTAEKGLSVLLEAWTRLELSIPLKIAGDGPLRAELEACAKGRGLTDVQFLGRLGRSEAIETIKRARFLVLPSLWYEGFPMVLVESFACGVPVLASRLGAMEELVQHGRVGLHFTPGEPSDLAAKATWAWEHPLEMAAMGREARQTYETQYGAEANYQLLMGIYNSVVHSAIQTNGSLAGELLGVGQ